MEERVAARADIEATGDLLERALKLAGLLATLFQECGYPLVVVGGSAVEFYTEGGYMSGDIDFCRKTLKPIPPRLMQEIAESLGYNNISHFTRQFHAVSGMTPLKYRKEKR